MILYYLDYKIKSDNLQYDWMGCFSRFICQSDIHMRTKVWQWNWSCNNEQTIFFLIFFCFKQMTTYRNKLFICAKWNKKIILLFAHKSNVCVCHIDIFEYSRCESDCVCVRSTNRSIAFWHQVHLRRCQGFQPNHGEIIYFSDHFCNKSFVAPQNYWVAFKAKITAEPPAHTNNFLS